MLALLLVSLILGIDPTQGQPSDPCVSGTVALEAHVSECGSFWHCSNGIWSYSMCPPNSFWNDAAKKCDVDTSGTCFVGNDNIVPPACSAPDSHFTSDLNQCSTFTREVNGVVREYRCAAGMVYNHQNSQCDWPENYPQCSVPSETPSLVRADLNECLMPCPSDYKAVYPRITTTGIRCGEYYVCIDGELFIGFCSDIDNGAFPIFDGSIKSCTAEKETINVNCPGTA